MESGVGIIGTQLSCMKLSHNIKLIKENRQLERNWAKHLYKQL